MPLLVKEGALDEGLEDGLDAVLVFVGLLDDVLEVLAVFEAVAFAGGVEGELSGEVGGEVVFVLENEVSELVDVFELMAIGEFSGGIDFATEADVLDAASGGEDFEVGFHFPFAVDPNVLWATSGAVVFAIGSDDVEVFQGHSWRVHGFVAGCTGGVGSVCLDLFAYGDGSRSIGFDCRNIGWRGAKVQTEDAFGKPGSPDDWRGGGAVGGDFENGSLGKESSSGAVGRQLVGFQLGACDSFELIEFCQALVDEEEVGVDNVVDAAVFLNEFGEIGSGFFEHGVSQPGIKFGVELWVRGGEVDVFDVEPLIEEMVDKSSGFRVGEKSFGLLLQNFWVV